LQNFLFDNQTYKFYSGRAAQLKSVEIAQRKIYDRLGWQEEWQIMEDSGSNAGSNTGSRPGGSGAPRTGRMTHTELKAMKAVQTKEARPDVALIKKLQAGLADIGAYFMGFVPGGHHNPCAINGHVMPKTWDGDFPRCKHCNHEIKSPEDLTRR
jgi:hypothetical protein